MRAQLTVRRPQRDALRPIQSRKLFAARADIYERKDAVVVMVELPADGEATAHVRLEGHDLVIKGLPRLPAEDIGQYEFRFRISRLLDADRLDAGFVNNALRIVLPKTDAEPPCLGPHERKDCYSRAGPPESNQ